MLYMLDTDTCIYLIKRNREKVLERYTENIRESFCISWITYLELCYGIEKSQSKKINQERLLDFLRDVAVEPIESHEVINHYAKIRVELERTGEPLDQLDLLIAAHAKALNATLVTNNTKHFKRVKGLKLENWAA